jgi:Domain of unknown function (DUF4349)
MYGLLKEPLQCKFGVMECLMRLVNLRVSCVVTALAAVSACSAPLATQTDRAAAPAEMVQASEPASAPADASVSREVAPDQATSKVAGEGGAASQSDPSANSPAVGGILLAYSYSARFSLPRDNVGVLKRKHEAECAAAGVNTCQIVTAALQSDDDGAQANLSIRATPAWLGGFRGRLESDAKGQDGKLVEQNVSSEDLTRAITDSEARLRALKALRARLEALIADRPAKLADLLDAERELARVQGDIDSFESNLAVMRARVDMSAMDLTYQSRSVAVGGGTFDPLVRAITGFVGVMAGSLGAVITFIAMVLPFALVLGPLGWWGLRWRAKRARAAKAVQGDLA